MASPEVVTEEFVATPGVDVYQKYNCPTFVTGSSRAKLSPMVGTSNTIAGNVVEPVEVGKGTAFDCPCQANLM
jgi:hypothetical protein